ncbi:hypothetical protein BGI32_10630 [Snodgrassella alvi]|uniref:Lipoprotein n=1 Tax=Snodgrassella alvi TaxID=1196083 RepID=A0A2N9WRB6_9NEIS|nr:hypothetical protein [Snodgrassella alvi]PIT12448.1 hypothetical protein BGI32_10630 [Snodgrassella alvi]
MKVLKTIALMSMSLVLFGCDNSKSADANKASSDIAQSTEKSELGKIQDAYINDAKRYLPKKVDSNSNLVDIYKENDTINYKYVMDINKDELDLPGTKKITTSNLKQVYCGTNPELVKFRESFANGVNHYYYIKDKEIFSVHLSLSDCETK